MDSKMKFYTLNLNVDDLCKSVSFYKALGFQVDKNSANEDYLFVIMELPETGFKICLRQFFLKKHKNKSKISIGLVIDDNSVSFKNMCKKFKARNIRYDYLDPYHVNSSGVYEIAVFKDPNGNEIEFTNELNPTFDYDQHFGY